MSGNQSWKRSLQSYHEMAISLVREAITALRESGVKTDAALAIYAEAIDSPNRRFAQRRVRTLFHRDGEPIVLLDEMKALNYRTRMFFLNLAAHFRKLADKHEARGEALLSEDQKSSVQMEFRWEQTCAKNEDGFGSSSSRSAYI